MGYIPHDPCIPACPSAWHYHLEDATEANAWAQGAHQADLRCAFYVGLLPRRGERICDEDAGRRIGALLSTARARLVLAAPAG